MSSDGESKRQGKLTRNETGLIQGLCAGTMEHKARLNTNSILGSTLKCDLRQLYKESATVIVLIFLKS